MLRNCVIVNYFFHRYGTIAQFFHRVKNKLLLAIIIILKIWSLMILLWFLMNRFQLIKQKRKRRRKGINKKNKNNNSIQILMEKVKPQNLKMKKLVNNLKCSIITSFYKKFKRKIKLLSLKH